jgi:hypothetical protein
MSKRDLKRELKEFYHASAKHVAEVDVPEFRYLMIDGMGDPSHSPSYQQAVEALFSVSYTTKFALKKQGGVDYTVMPLEGLWWAEDWSVFLTDDRSQWQWTMMILQPDFVPEKIIQASILKLAQTKNLPALDQLRLEHFHEGPSVQILHIGPFSEERATIERLHQHLDSMAERRGKHHEIYLSDVRRAAPEKWKTILRQPMHKER